MFMERRGIGMERALLEEILSHLMALESVVCVTNGIVGEEYAKMVEDVKEKVFEKGE